jgi:hypothetical protein
MKLKHHLVTGHLIVLLVLLFNIQGRCGCPDATGLTTSSITSNSAEISWNQAGAGTYKVRYKKSSVQGWTTVSVNTNSYTLSGLTPSTSYQWKVLANCTKGNSGYTFPVTFTTQTGVCPVPSGLNATSVSASSATLEWNNTADAVSYNIQYRITGSSSWTTETSSVNSTSVSGLTSNSSYEFQVQTVCIAGGNSAWSSSSAFNTLQQTCTTPGGLNSSSITSTGATLAWNAVSDANGYDIQYRPTGSSNWLQTTSTTNSKSISGLTSGASYEFQVQTSCTWGGTSSWSSSSNFTTSLPPCAVAAGLNAGSITTTGAALEWTAVNGAVSYNVQYRAAGSSIWTSTTASTNSKIISGLSSGTTYEFQVQTVCSGNTSAWSASANFTTQSPCMAPTGPSASAITQSSATVSWNAAAGALSYSVQYRKTGTTSWDATTSTTTSKNHAGLLAATNYEFQVVTVCSNGNSSWSSSSNFTTANSTTLPVPDHIVILIEENHGYSQVIGSSSAPYINALANDPMSTLFTQMYGVEHPSQPNYLDLFSGGNQGVTNNNVPLAHFTTANLAKELLNAGQTFISFSQNLPSVGYDGASSGKYMRKHNPVTNWMGTGTNQVPSTLNQPFSAFPSDFNNLPTVSFVIPDQDYDMHDGSIATADTWFHNNLDAYVQWAKTHNSLFILIFDEDDGNYNNRIPMIFTGPMVKSGTLSTTYNHYNVLRTIEDMYGTTHAGNAASASSIHGCWLNGYKQSAEVTLSGSGFRWEVFPNPASSVINITYEMEDASDPGVTVYDNLGQKLKGLYLPETGNGSHQISFSTADLGMTRGIYFLEMNVGSKKYLKKIAVLE